MDDALQAILTEAQAGAAKVAAPAELEELKARVVGPNGSFTAAMKGIAKLTKEERPAFGRRINEVKEQLEQLFARALLRLQEAQQASRLGPPPDPTLPSPDGPPGSFHLLTQVREEICSILRKVGFVVVEGPEVETEYCETWLPTSKVFAPARVTEREICAPG